MKGRGLFWGEVVLWTGLCPWTGLVLVYFCVHCNNWLHGGHSQLLEGIPPYLHLGCFSFYQEYVQQNYGEQNCGVTMDTGEFFMARTRVSHPSHTSTSGMSAALFGGGVRAIIPILWWKGTCIEGLPSQPLMNVYRKNAEFSLLLFLSSCFIHIFRLLSLLMV